MKTDQHPWKAGWEHCRQLYAETISSIKEKLDLIIVDGDTMNRTELVRETESFIEEQNHYLQNELQSLVGVIQNSNPEDHQALLFIIGKELRGLVDINGSQIESQLRIYHNINFELIPYKIKFLMKIVEVFLLQLEGLNSELKGNAKHLPIAAILMQQELTSYINSVIGLQKELSEFLEAKSQLEIDEILIHRNDRFRKLKKKLSRFLTDLKQDNQKAFDQFVEKESNDSVIKGWKFYVDNLRKQPAHSQVIEFFEIEMERVAELIKLIGIYKTTTLFDGNKEVHPFRDQEMLELFRYFHKNFKNHRPVRWSYIFYWLQDNTSDFTVSQKAYTDYVNANFEIKIKNRLSGGMKSTNDKHHRELNRLRGLFK